MRSFKNGQRDSFPLFKPTVRETMGVRLQANQSLQFYGVETGMGESSPLKHRKMMKPSRPTMIKALVSRSGAMEVEATSDAMLVFPPK